MSILKNILISALGALFYQNSELKAEPINVNDNNKFDIDKIINDKSKSDLSLKLRLKLNSGGEWIMNSHRSHRSHSSHRSHYSSQGGHYSHFSSSSGTTNTNSNSSSGTSINTYNSTSVKSYSLGDRTLYKGMKGTDVTELVNYLVSKNYLSFEDGSTTAFGSYEFDDTVYDAVKRFQKDNGLKSDGIAGSTTVYYLKK